MTVYRLPDGVEIESLDINGSTSDDKAWVTHPVLGSILIARDKLTEVPSEPEDGFVGRFGADIWQRDDLPETNGDSGPGEHWWHTGNAEAFTWAELCVFLRDSGEELIPLVPVRGDSVVILEKVGLPWAFTDNDGDRLLIERLSSAPEAYVGVENNAGRAVAVAVSPDEAYQAAMALLNVWAAHKGIEAA